MKTDDGKVQGIVQKSTNSSCFVDDCSVEVPQELNMIPPTIKGIAYTMFGLNAVLVLIGGIWLRVHWNSPEVKYR